jgi:hypothetical protein
MDMKRVDRRHRLSRGSSSWSTLLTTAPASFAASPIYGQPTRDGDHVGGYGIGPIAQYNVKATGHVDKLRRDLSV